MTLKDLQAMKTRENVKLDTMIKVREILDAAKKEWTAAGGERDEWSEVEEEIKERVFEDE